MLKQGANMIAQKMIRI